MCLDHEFGGKANVCGGLKHVFVFRIENGIPDDLLQGICIYARLADDAARRCAAALNAAVVENQNRRILGQADFICAENGHIRYNRARCVCGQLISLRGSLYFVDIVAVKRRLDDRLKVVKIGACLNLGEIIELFC